MRQLLIILIINIFVSASSTDPEIQDDIAAMYG